MHGHFGKELNRDPTAPLRGVARRVSRGLEKGRSQQPLPAGTGPALVAYFCLSTFRSGATAATGVIFILLTPLPLVSSRPYAGAGGRE